MMGRMRVMLRTLSKGLAFTTVVILFSLDQSFSQFHYLIRKSTETTDKDEGNGSPADPAGQRDLRHGIDLTSCVQHDEGKGGCV